MGRIPLHAMRRGKASDLTYLDRENQRRSFPSWLMNRMMPRYLVYQAEQVRRFFDGAARRNFGPDV
jgi:hypothetical protein